MEMTRKRLAKLRRELQDKLRHPQNTRANELISLANQVGRILDNRGKEPTYVRASDPSLSPPLSIPNHPGEMRPLTVKSIVSALLSDCDDWDSHLDQEDDKNE